MSMLYCMECKEFVPVWDEHPCPSNYYAAVDKEMTGIVDRLYRMGIKPMIAVCSAVFVNRKMGHILIENWASCKKN